MVLNTHSRVGIGVKGPAAGTRVELEAEDYYYHQVCSLHSVHHNLQRATGSGPWVWEVA